MDINHYPSLQRLAQLSAQLAVTRRNAPAIEDDELDDDERLLRAVAAGDWSVAATVSTQLAASLSDRGDERLVRAARKTGAALRRSPSASKTRRQVKELMAAVRDAKARRRAG